MPPLHDCYAITAPGIESITAGELASLGATPGKIERGGIEFSATPALLYAANLHSRTASRIVVRVAEFGARTFFELERHAKKIPWERFVAPGGAVSFRVTSRKSKLYHHGAIEERLLRWAGEAGFAGESEGSRVTSEESRVKSEEEVNSEAADGGAGAPTNGAPPFHSSLFTPHSQLFLVRLHRDRVTVSADSSGELLHRRGYRLATAKAPVRETLAAAMLLASGWDGTAPLIDPLCGAGTIPIEAALMTRKIAPGKGRAFAFERWPEFERTTWEQVERESVNGERPKMNGTILGSDRDAGAIAASIANAERAGVVADIAFTQRDLVASATTEKHPGGWLVTNPPYGVRVGDDRHLAELYATLGKVAQAMAPNGHIGVLSADPRLDAHIRIPLEEKFSTENGGIGVRFVLGRS